MTVTPFRTPRYGLEPSWLDYNGHLNMAYYNVLFDKGVDALFDELGCGAAYRENEDKSFFTAEAHVCYLRELKPDAEVYIDVRLVDCDAKRIHVFEQLYHREGWLSATSETLLLHIDMTGPKVVPIGEALANRFAALKAAHATLPADERIGRKIGIRKA